MTNHDDDKEDKITSESLLLNEKRKEEQLIEKLCFAEDNHRKNIERINIALEKIWNSHNISKHDDNDNNDNSTKADMSQTLFSKRLSSVFHKRFSQKEEEKGHRKENNQQNKRVNHELVKKDKDIEMNSLTIQVEDEESNPGGSSPLDSVNPMLQTCEST
eukprot:CAMPEP_0114346816 /NCGR_PEP_ID=MMETSP0101-20121206/13379_1 /TAXON_ID=38822 ORGANISM="Pteridomonas danica, Strain PT" /NCGR_SAMPLE_ID=MMETSP0101 /ASSEMBLY_ACC=CAM_ASM_000211 /LENGTH=159 /DNA_ID=CAMNT_0001483705 /DNA_START=310 /DNA_END=786 /DNA_ORIENTATION=-